MQWLTGRIYAICNALKDFYRTKDTACRYLEMRASLKSTSARHACKFYMAL